MSDHTRFRPTNNPTEFVGKVIIEAIQMAPGERSKGGEIPFAQIACTLDHVEATPAGMGAALAAVAMQFSNHFPAAQQEWCRRAIVSQFIVSLMQPGGLESATQN